MNVGSNHKMIHIEDLCAKDLFSPETKSLSVSDGSPAAYKVFRLFTGQVRISCEITSTSYEVYNDAIALYYNRCTDNFIKKIASYIFEEEDLDIVSSLAEAVSIPRLRYRNAKYFQELYNELCNYQFAVNARNSVTAFIYEYRILEYIAYACPLIYAVQSHDFYMTFAHLKNYVSNQGKNQGKGELNFFKNAINKIFEGNDILSTSFDISLINITNESIKDAYQIILKEHIKPEWLHETTSDDIFAIKFNEVSSVLIELRNKIFHHSVNTPDNLLASQLLDMNHFMGLITPTFFTWLGIVYLEIFKSILSFERN